MIYIISCFIFKTEKEIGLKKHIWVLVYFSNFIILTSVFSCIPSQSVNTTFKNS